MRERQEKHFPEKPFHARARTRYPKKDIHVYIHFKEQLFREIARASRGSSLHRPIERKRRRRVCIIRRQREISRSGRLVFLQKARKTTERFYLSQLRANPFVPAATPSEKGCSILKR